MGGGSGLAASRIIVLKFIHWTERLRFERGAEAYEGFLCMCDGFTVEVYDEQHLADQLTKQYHAQYLSQSRLV